MFTVALFLIDRNWKQSRCPQTEEWKKKMFYIYIMEYDSAIKKKTMTLWNLQANGRTRKYPEVYQTQKDKHGMYSFTSGY